MEQYLLPSDNHTYDSQQYTFDTFFKLYAQPCSFKQLIHSYNKFAEPTTVGGIDNEQKPTIQYVQDTTFFDLYNTNALEINNFKFEEEFNTPLLKALYNGFVEAQEQ